MNLFHAIRSSLRTLFFRRATAREVEDELQFHLDAHIADLMAQGVPKPEARRRARVELGLPIGQYAEVHRRAVSLQLVDDTVADMRYGLRGLWHNKPFALTAILSLALGIGATTAMFSVVYAVLLDVYPYADSNRTVNPIVHDPNVPDDWNWFVLNRDQFAQYKAAPCFEDAFAMSGLQLQLDENDVQMPLHITTLSGNASAFNQVPALVGRTLQPSDGDFGDKPSNVAVLGYKFWKSHYAGDKTVIGQNLKAGSNLYRIVGVMPERYTLGGSPDLYMPISQFSFPNAHYIVFAKLKRGVTAQQASETVDPMIHEFAKAEPLFYPKEFHVRLQPLLEGFTARSKLLKNFPLLYFAVGALLVIGCGNCSLLLLARGMTRVHEFALRSAVGASRSRILRQLLVECMTISLLGSVLGIGLAYWLARLPLQLADDLFPTESVIRVNGAILAFSVTTAICAGLIFGLLPAIKFSRPEISTMLNANGRRTIASAGKGVLRVLIAAQIALTLVLLTLSGAAMGGFMRLLRMPLGYDPSNTMALYVGMGKDVAPTWPDRVSLASAMTHAIENVPGVVSATVADGLPPSVGGSAQFHFTGEDDQNREAKFTSVSPSYFATLRISMLKGRTFTDAEWRAGIPLAVVNESFVRRFSPNQSVLDRVIRTPALSAVTDPRIIEGRTFSPALKDTEVRIIGVSADAVNDGLDKPVAPNLYINSNTANYGFLPLLVRTRTDSHAYEHEVARAIHQLGSKNFITIVPHSLQEMVEHENVWRTQRLVAVLLSIFALGALALSLVGLYSVVTYVVAQRTQEFGIRIALGAARSGILLLVLRSNATVILGGSLVGVLLSLIARSRFAQWSEYSSRSPVVVLAATLVLGLTALAASLLPAYRASRVEPADALRAE